MSFDARIWFYPGANPNSTPDAWEPRFKEISSFVRRPGNDGGAPIVYSSGKQDESTQTDAGQMTLTLDNRDGRFSTENMAGPYFGLLDINTPIRLVTRVFTDSFTRTVSGGLGTIDAVNGISWPTGAPSQYSVNGSQGQVVVTGANTFTATQVTGANCRDVDIFSSVIPLA